MNAITQTPTPIGPLPLKISVSESLSAAWTLVACVALLIIIRHARRR